MADNANATWTVAGRTFTSRLIVGTGKYKDFAQNAAAVEASGAEIGLDPARVAVERNLEIVPRSTLASVKVVDGDAFEIVHFVGGG